MTASTPPAWAWLDVPIAYPANALSIHSRKLPDSDALSIQNDSPDPTYQGCRPSERYLSDGPAPGEFWNANARDQCPECRCGPGQSHALGCDVSSSPDVSCDRKDDAPGCDEAAQVTNAQSNAVETYVFPEIGQFPGQETGVAEETHEDLQGKDADSFVVESCGSCADTACADILPEGEMRNAVPPCAYYVESCPECGAVADIDYGTVKDKPPDKTTWTVLLTDGYREMAEENLEAAEAFVGACEPEPARSAIGAGPLFSSRCDSSEADRIMDNNPLLNHMESTFRSCMDTAVAKNEGYAGSADPMANFKESVKLGVPVPIGVAIRLSDKWARLCRLLQTGENPLADESITDTIMDAINYLAILLYALDGEA